jgi:hypothetical protein
LTQDVAKLQAFQEVYPQLKAIEQLLSNVWWRKRFQYSCIPVGGLRDMLNHFSANLITWRW